MLILRRSLGEKLVIGEGDSAITVTVEEIHRGAGRPSVKLSVQGPRDMRVLRAELLRGDPPPVDREAGGQAR